MSDTFLLYSRSTSSASYRVRIALHLKEVLCDTCTLDAQQQHCESHGYHKINPQGLVPLLVHTTAGRDIKLSQSVAIMEYLQDVFPQQGVTLLPEDLAGRSRVKSLALHIACEMQPLNNSRVVKYVQTDLKADAATAKRWQLHWAEKGFQGLEKELESTSTGQFCHGDSPTIADCCLVPQVSNSICTPSFQGTHSEICAVISYICNCAEGLPIPLYWCTCEGVVHTRVPF